MWFNVDDGLADSPEVMSIPARYRMSAIGLWTVIGVWMSKQGQEFCPLQIITKLGGTQLLAQQLTRCGLLDWEVRDGSGGLAYTARRCRVKGPEDVRKQREATADRVRAHRARREKPHEQQEPDDVTVLHKTDTECYASRARDGDGYGYGDNSPIPVQAKSLRKSGTALARGAPLPEDWQPSEKLKTELRAAYPELKLGSVLEEFRDYWLGVPGQRGHKLDWDRTFRNRVREVAHMPRFQRNGQPIGAATRKAMGWDAFRETEEPRKELTE